MEYKHIFIGTYLIIQSIILCLSLMRCGDLIEQWKTEKRFKKSLDRIRKSMVNNIDRTGQNSCVPITLAMTTGWDMRSSLIIASYYMKRQDDKGVRIRNVRNFMGRFSHKPLYGVRFEKVYVKNVLLKDTLNWKGTYFVIIPGHALSVIDGEIISSARDDMSSKVRFAWRVLKENN